MNHVLETLDQNEPEPSALKAAKGFRAVDLVADPKTPPKSEVVEKENSILRSERLESHEVLQPNM